MEMNKTKLVFPFFIMIGFLSNLSAQEEGIVVDTIYDKYLTWNGYYLLIGNEQESILVKGDTISRFPVQVDGFKAGNLGVPLIQVDDRCYLLNDELDFDPDKYVEINLRNVSDLCVYGNKASYVKGSSVFVADFDTHETNFVLENAGVFKINEQYIWMQGKSTEEDYIYHFETKKISKLPPAFMFPKAEHPYFVVNAPLDENVHVLDLNLNDVISPSEGYTDYHIRGELLLVYGRQKPVKAFYKDKPLTLAEEYVDVACNYYSNMCFLTNSEAKVAVLNPDGEFLTLAIFDESIHNSFQDKEIILIKKGDLHQAYTPGFEKIIEGDYDKVSYVSEDRIMVEKNGRIKVVDTSKVEVIPNFPFIPSYISAFTEYGPELLFAYNGTSRMLYDYNGAEIVGWTNEKGDEFVNSGKFFRALNLRTVNALSDEQEACINPSGRWILRRKIGGRNVEFLCDKSGERLSEDFKKMILLEASGLYLVQTRSRKVGIITL